MTMDLLIMGTALLSFSVFLLAHLITFRWVAPEKLLRSLLVCVVAVLGLPVLFMAFFFVLKALRAPLPEWICATVLALGIEGLLCFVYVLCVFGPYETSVRMRLVREISAAGPGGISLQELLGRYNPELIVRIRLQRLTGSGDILESNGIFRLGHSRNFFFIFDVIAGVIKKWIGR